MKFSIISLFALSSAIPVSMAVKAVVDIGEGIPVYGRACPRSDCNTWGLSVAVYRGQSVPMECYTDSGTSQINGNSRWGRTRRLVFPGNNTAIIWYPNAAFKFPEGELQKCTD